MKRSPMKVMFKLSKLVLPLWKYMVLSVAAGTTGHLCITFMMVFAGYAILHTLGYTAPLSLPLLCICMILFALVRAFLRYGEQACNHYIAFRLLALIRDHVFQNLRRLAPAKLDTKDSGDLVSMITSDIELLEVFYAHTISPVMIALLSTVIMTIFIGATNILLGLLALCIWMAIGAGIPLISSLAGNDAGEGVRRTAGKLSSVLLDNMNGLSEIIQFGSGTKRMQVMDAMTDELLSWQEKEKGRNGNQAAMTGVFIYVADILMIAACLALYSNGTIQFSQALIVMITMMFSYGPVNALAALGTGLQNTIASGNRILDILEEEPVTKDISGQKDILFENVKIDNLGFGYDKQEILHDLSMSFDKEEIIGIIGRSGSGKSTLLKLLMRFYEAKQGKILISNTDINQINTSGLRKMEGYMKQESYLFHDTILNNLLIAKQDASLEEVKDACRKASVHDFIMTLEKGYDTIVDDHSVSSGEKQRIALARIFLHGGDFILLDEPSSNLDSLNEGLILKSLKEEARGKTLILVSHRNSTLRIADRIYEMNKGVIS